MQRKMQQKHIDNKRDFLKKKSTLKRKQNKYGGT